MKTQNFSYPIDLNNVKITDEFWNDIQNKVIEKVIPYQYDALCDNIENAEKSYCLENFRKAKLINEKIKNGESVPTFPTDKWHYDENNSDENSFHGWVFQDTDVYKWLEAVSYSLSIKWNDALYKKALDTIDLISSAQLENGYLDTLYIINNRDKMFTNLLEHHELYCFGHLAEAGVAFYECTKNRKLLDCAIKFADLICDTFGENKLKGYGGHEIAELALVKLYRTTKNKKYLNMATFFINERGKKPYYFDLERGKKTVSDNYFYNQAHIPPRQQTEAVGHAVRGAYLYSGMADVALENKDEELYSACEKIWDNIVNQKMYITGGIGSTSDGEAFSYNYDLPNDLAYNETCASIGLIFFGSRMLQMESNHKIADTIERALYNTVLASVNEAGDRFFYTNPLEVLPEACEKDSRKRHIKSQRQAWFGCACCPPNYARLITSIGKYCFYENRDTLIINQYIGAEINSKFGKINIDSKYLSLGKIKISVVPNADFTLSLRIPQWCENYTISENFELKDNYANIEIKSKTEIIISFEVKPKLVKCSNKVRENVDKLALTLGPFVYCLESVDNGNNLQMLKLDTKQALQIENDKIIAKGFRELPDENLYQDFEKPNDHPCTLTFIPYYRWGNTGETEMSVYFRYV